MKIIISKVLGLSLGFISIIACSSKFPVGSPCLDRDGRCFDAVVSGMRVEPIADQAKLTHYKAVAENPGLAKDLSDVRWGINQSIPGELSVQTSVNKDGTTWFGVNPKPSVDIIPLNGQQLNARAAIQKADTVKIGGKSVLTATNILTHNVVPPGDYLMRIRLSGPANWDRKIVFITVK